MNQSLKIKYTKSLENSILNWAQKWESNLKVVNGFGWTIRIIRSYTCIC